MEHRVVLSNKEAHKLSGKLEFLNPRYVRDEYTGTKRIRLAPQGRSEKDYQTPVSGIVHRLSSKCKMGNIENIWLEIKWTDKVTRFEIEFENQVPSEFVERKNITGWDILKNNL